MTILYSFVLFFVFIYIMTLIQVMKEHFDSLLITLFFYNAATLRNLHKYDDRLRKQVKSIVITSMVINLVIMILFSYYQYMDYSQHPVIFSLVPLNQLITPIIVTLVIKYAEKNKRLND